MLKDNRILAAFVRWFDTHNTSEISALTVSSRKADWVRTLPFTLLHLSCFSVIWVGWSPIAAIVAVLLYALRMFAITGIYHRYFSHRSYRTSRTVQFLFAVLGASAVQRGPLWWAAHHRRHHLYSDTIYDAHSPKQHGFWWSQIGWILSRENFPTDLKRVPDLEKYPELVFLNRFDVLVPFLLGFSLFVLGIFLQSRFPDLGTSGAQMLVWGFSISTILLFHATSTINSLAHLIGRKRYATSDDSKNSLILALLTFGEGWHNNHHHYQASTRQGFYWWEIDLTYYALFFLSKCGIVWNLQDVPERSRISGLYHKEPAPIEEDLRPETIAA
ncbi:MAG: acyl-CoA desaturase [Elusimicrobia bacterium]|nr:acyl-CoA desaturase [Elusimicrobiota bacterium]